MRNERDGVDLVNCTEHVKENCYLSAVIAVVKGAVINDEKRTNVGRYS